MSVEADIDIIKAYIERQQMSRTENLRAQEEERRKLSGPIVLGFDAFIDKLALLLGIMGMSYAIYQVGYVAYAIIKWSIFG